jgi:hypothetical protein
MKPSAARLAVIDAVKPSAARLAVIEATEASKLESPDGEMVSETREPVR